MRYSEIAKRYASALFQIGEESKAHDTNRAQINDLADVFEKDTSLKAFILSPLVPTAEKEKSVAKAITGAGLSKEVESFVLLLSSRERLGLLSEISAAYEARVDQKAGVTRGVVRSGAAVSEAERTEMQNAIGQATGKKVELEFVEDKTIIGGVIAKVGSLTFDDSLSSHLRRIEENLNRSVH